MAVLLRNNNPYSLAVIRNFDDTPPILERGKVDYTPTVEDILHEVVEGESLDTIAYKYYEDSKYWWLIADANELENPLDISEFNTLLIPNLERAKKNNIR